MRIKRDRKRDGMSEEISAAIHNLEQEAYLGLEDNDPKISYHAYSFLQSIDTMIKRREQYIEALEASQWSEVS